MTDKSLEVLEELYECPQCGDQEFVMVEVRKVWDGPDRGVLLISGRTEHDCS